MQQNSVGIAMLALGGVVAVAGIIVASVASPGLGIAFLLCGLSSIAVVLALYYGFTSAVDPPFYKQQIQSTNRPRLPVSSQMSEEAVANCDPPCSQGLKCIDNKCVAATCALTNAWLPLESNTVVNVYNENGPPGSINMGKCSNSTMTATFIGLFSRAIVETNISVSGQHRFVISDSPVQILLQIGVAGLRVEQPGLQPVLVHVSPLLLQAREPMYDTQPALLRVRLIIDMVIEAGRIGYEISVVAPSNGPEVTSLGIALAEQDNFNASYHRLAVTSDGGTCFALCFGKLRNGFAPFPDSSKLVAFNAKDEVNGKITPILAQPAFTADVNHDQVLYTVICDAQDDQIDELLCSVDEVGLRQITSVITFYDSIDVVMITNGGSTTTSSTISIVKTSPVTMQVSIDPSMGESVQIATDSMLAPYTVYITWRVNESNLLSASIQFGTQPAFELNSDNDMFASSSSFDTVLLRWTRVAQFALIRE
jgi:hypothetical protein